MSAAAAKTQAVSFSPGLHLDDAVAAHWLRQVTLRLRREVCWLWHESDLTRDAVAGDLPPQVNSAVASLEIARYWDDKKKFFEEDATAAYLSDQLAIAAPAAGEELRRGSFGWLVDELELAQIDCLVLALGLSVTFDNAVGSVVGACLNDARSVHPTLALAQKLWDRPNEVLRLADPGHPLFGRGLVQRGGLQGWSSAGLDWNQPIFVSSMVAEHMLYPSSGLPRLLRDISTEGKRPGNWIGNGGVVASRLRARPADRLRIIPVVGPRGCDKAAAAAHVSRTAGRRVVEFDGDARFLQSAESFDALTGYCWLRDLDLFIAADAVRALSPAKEPDARKTWPSEGIATNLFLAAESRDELKGLPSAATLPQLVVPALSYPDRVKLWRRCLGKRAKGQSSIIRECSRRFRFEERTVRSICDHIGHSKSKLTRARLFEACRAEAQIDMGDLAQELIPRFERKELVLPHKQDLQLDEVVRGMNSLGEVHYGWGTAQAWNEAGIGVLFAGPPGTGKTMAAEVLASELELPLYRIDLSQVVNKYIGETEKNLKKVFDASDACDMVLLCDEADALFGRRTEVKDAHDRYANLETSYLLNRMECSKGLTILATNRKNDLDEAFVRRLRYIIDFPGQPGVEAQKKIWKSMFPPSVNTEAIDVSFLAEQFQLTGGLIRSSVFNACLQSAWRPPKAKRKRPRKLRMEDLLIAVHRELEKANRVTSRAQFEPYHSVVDTIERAAGGE